MKVLELFAGSRSIGKVAESLGHEVFSVDIMEFEKIDLVTDILDLGKKDIPFKPDMIWASPPCTYFSVASIGKHWNRDHSPKTKEALHGCKIVLKTISLIKEINPRFYYIENPRGKLRKLEFMKYIPRTTIWYCQYGDKRAKPTDIWSNNIYSIYNQDGWIPKKECFNGNKNCHHEPAPRGSKTGTQGLKDNYTRSKIPAELCQDIIEFTAKRF